MESGSNSSSNDISFVLICFYLFSSLILWLEPQSKLKKCRNYAFVVSLQMTLLIGLTDIKLMKLTISGDLRIFTAFVVSKLSSLQNRLFTYSFK